MKISAGLVFRRFFQGHLCAPAVGQRFSQNELDLAIDAPQLVLCPTPDGLQELGIDAQQK